MCPKGIIIKSGPILRICKIIKRNRYYFRNETQSKQYEILVFKLRMKQVFHYDFSSLDTPFMAAQKQSVPILFRFSGYVKIRKRWVVFSK